MTDSAQSRPPGPLDVGDPAPAILLPNQHGETVSPTQDSLAGTPSILALYPSVADPTAVRELGCFRDHFDAITEHGARLFVVSRDPVASLAQLGAQEANTNLH